MPKSQCMLKLHICSTYFSESVVPGHCPLCSKSGGLCHMVWENLPFYRGLRLLDTRAGRGTWVPLYPRVLVTLVSPSPDERTPLGLATPKVWLLPALLDTFCKIRPPLADATGVLETKVLSTFNSIICQRHILAVHHQWRVIFFTTCVILWGQFHHPNQSLFQPVEAIIWASRGVKLHLA